MSLERIIQTLRKWGISRSEAEIYVYLDNKGALDKKGLLRGLKMDEKKLLSSLKNLEKKGLVISKVKESKEFSAVAFEKVIERLIRIKTKQSKEALETKKELLASWKSVDWKNNS